jgi:translocation and assembly module TamB
LPPRTSRATIERLKKRTVALASLALLVALVVATLLALRTRWVGERICALAAARAAAASGLPLAFGSCRIDPFRLELEAEGVRLGDAAAPLLEVDRVSARLAPIQGFGGRLQLARVHAVRPRVVARLEGGGGGGACPPPALDQIDVQRLDVEEGALDLALRHGLHVSVGRIDVSSLPVAPSFRAFSSEARRSRVQVALASARLTGAGHPITATRLAADVEVALDLSGATVAGLDAEVDGVRVSAHGRVDRLCAPALELSATAIGGFREVLALARIADRADAEGRVVAEAKISGPAADPRVAGTVRLEKARVAFFTPGDVRAEVRLVPGGLAVDRVDWPYGGGRVTGHGSVGFRLPVRLDAELDAAGVDLAEILERLGIAGSWVTVKLDGKGKVGGTLAPPAVAGTFTAEFRELRALTRSWRVAPPSERGVVEVKRGRIAMGVRVNEQEVAFDAARVTAGRGTSEVDAVARFSREGGFSLRWRGQVDLDVMGRVATIPWSGLAEVDGTIAAAPYANPRIVARGTRVDGFRFDELDLGNAVADIHYGPDFVIRVQEGRGVKGQTRYSGEAAVDLGVTPPRVLSSRFEAKGRVEDFLEAVRDWLPATRILRGRMAGEGEVSGTATGPAGKIDAVFESRLGAGTLLGRAFDSGHASGALVGGAEARLDRAELRRGPGSVRWQGRWGVAPPIPWDLDVSFAGVPVDALELPGGAWTGSASGSAVLKGSFDVPDVRFAANGDGVSVRGLALGSIQLGGTIQGRRLIATANSDAVRLQGQATLEGRLPFQAKADLALDDVARLVPGAVPAGLKARARGEAEAEGELLALGETRARVRLDALEAGHADFRVEATGPVVLTVNHGRVDVQTLVLKGPNTELTLSGSRAASGELDLVATGNLDLRLLSGLVPELRRPHGLLALEAHVSGTVPEPVLVGAGRLDDAGFQLKASNVLFSEMRGELAFSQNRVLFERLTAAVNGGRAEMKGEVELASFAPVRLHIESRLDEVPVAVTAWLPATLSGRVEAAGTPDATTVTGRLHVVRSRYTANVDLEKSVLEFRRRTPVAARPYDKAGEWLRFDLQIVVDGDARVENDLVSGGVKGDLVLTGNLAAPGLVGTLSMADGSRARFRGNEFALSHAVLEFTERNRIEMGLDVHGESRVRDYQIFMHAFGPLADPHVTLTSNPALSQPDIITLLSIGFTRRDTGAGGSVQGVATAAAAQALFSASGLDEQVKRFVPRNNLLRDFSVRITSEWSENSGQVEPRAELESWFLRDRLRLRFQAPLSGGRGQRAQAELRLGSHTAVQWEWDSDNRDVPTGDHGVDLKLRWEWTDR